MSDKKVKNIFVSGPITPEFIANSIANHSKKTNIGAHQIFLGQVRADTKESGNVESIEYTSYQDMANEKMHIFREKIFQMYNLTCMHIYHSLGNILVGEICVFVFVSSSHRKDSILACNELIEFIKKELPIWGKEIVNSHSYNWKINE